MRADLFLEKQSIPHHMPKNPEFKEELKRCPSLKRITHGLNHQRGNELDKEKSRG